MSQDQIRDMVLSLPGIRALGYKERTNILVHAVMGSWDPRNGNEDF